MFDRSFLVSHHKFGVVAVVVENVAKKVVVKQHGGNSPLQKDKFGLFIRWNQTAIDLLTTCLLREASSN